MLGRKAGKLSARDGGDTDGAVPSGFVKHKRALLPAIDLARRARA